MYREFPLAVAVLEHLGARGVDAYETHRRGVAGGHCRVLAYVGGFLREGHAFHEHDNDLDHSPFATIAALMGEDSVALFSNTVEFFAVLFLGLVEGGD